MQWRGSERRMDGHGGVGVRCSRHLDAGGFPGSLSAQIMGSRGGLAARRRNVSPCPPDVR